MNTEYMTINEVADYFGVSHMTIRREVREMNIPHIMVRRSVRIHRGDLERYVKAHQYRPERKRPF